MKITYLKLKNYASIYTAMGLKEIEIDFTKSKNKVILFVGDNGSGKTSILSALHPFPYYGSMDVRNNTNIIREDKDGYKEIHIQNKNDLYIIKHHYKNTKRGIVLKSFISKNNEELNMNGNVTSFNELIKNELSLEIDFLKLLRLGSNVTNLIDMKASERKTFTSFLLSDINLYTDLYKKVNNDNKILKGLIKSVSDKLLRLNISDLSLVEDEINKLERDINTLNDKNNELQKSLGMMEGRINTLAPEGKESIIKKKNELELEIQSNISNLKSINRAIEKMCIILPHDINIELSRVSEELNKTKNEITVNDNMKLFYTEKLNSLYNKRNSLQDQLKSISTGMEHRQLVELISSIDMRISEYEKTHIKTPTYNKDTLVILLDIGTRINNLCKEILSHDMKVIKSVIELLLNGNNVNTYIYSKMNKIDKKIMEAGSVKVNINDDTPIILFKPQNCPENNCPYLYLHDLLFSNKVNKQSIHSLENEKEFLEDMKVVYGYIDYIYNTLYNIRSVIEKVDIEDFNTNHILNSLIENKSWVIDIDYITDLISDAEDYDEYNELKSKVKELSLELKSLSVNENNIDHIKKELYGIDKEISDYVNNISNIETDNIVLNKVFNTLTDYHESLLKYDEYIKLLPNIDHDLYRYKNELDIIVDTLDKISHLSKESTNISKDIESTNLSITRLNKELFELRVKANNYIALNEERDLLNERFDDISLIRESLSSNKGIPLLYMQLYLKSTKVFVNYLLKEVYSNNFEIDDFDINESEFNIPYIKNNIRISDVAYASQGEKSFLSLALSFALINNSMKDYNILLLDEIDSTLDTRNRAMFINILEKQMDSIDAEQVFLITHNNMFENYPVDLILTSDNKANNFNNMNIIFSI